MFVQSFGESFDYVDHTDADAVCLVQQKKKKIERNKKDWKTPSKKMLAEID
jgi:hypothetical protein